MRPVRHARPKPTKREERCVEYTCNPTEEREL